jgi:hypothetical protein
VIRLFRFLFSLSLLVGFIWFGATVKLGRFTFFEHVTRIWHTQETQELVKGTKDSAGPALGKLKHEIHEATR